MAKTKRKKRTSRQSRLNKPTKNSEEHNLQVEVVGYLIPPDSSPLKRALWTYANWSSITLSFSLFVYLLLSNSYSFKRLPPVVAHIVVYGLLYSSIMDIFVLRPFVGSDRFKTDPKFARLVRFLVAFGGVLVTTLLNVTLFYISGAIELLTAFLQTHWPSIEPKLSYYLSTLIGWIVSGILGNAAYDLLKRLKQKMRSQRESGVQNK